MVADSEPVGFVKNGKVQQLHIAPEAPHRRRYKRLLAAYFLAVSLLNLVLDLTFQVNKNKHNSMRGSRVTNRIFQIQSSAGVELDVVESEEEAAVFMSSGSGVIEYEATEVSVSSHADNLATALYVIGHLQQIGDPLIFLFAEFGFK